MQQSMHNHLFAQRAWRRLRDSRPLNRTHPSDEKRCNAARQSQQVKDALAEAFAASCSQQDQMEPELPTTQQEGENLMIKLNCGVSRKVGEPNYGSRGASVNVELELESATVQDPKLLHEKIRRLFALAKTSVDEELGLANAPAMPPASNPAPNSQPPHHTGAPANGNGGKPATDSQLRAIWAISNQLGLDQDAEAHRMYQRPASQLSVPEASRLIDHLKQVQGACGGR